MSNLHTTSGRWRFGLALSLTTALMWGVLPIALKLTLVQMDAVTVTWYRFSVAALIVGATFAMRRRGLRLGELDRTAWILLAICILGVCGNYLFYLLGLDYVTPGTAQVVIQIAPMMLLLGALAIYRESFSKLQWAGVASFVGGLALFFNNHLVSLFAGGPQGTGVGIIVVSAVVWACYALAQKQLLRAMSSPRILLCIYIAATALFLPWSAPAQVLDISALTFAMLAFASLNTVIAYGAFAEAMNHWEASRVSAVVALAPMFTFLAMVAAERFVPGFPLNETVTPLRLAGAGAVVAGSMMTALGGHARA